MGSLLKSESENAPDREEIYTILNIYITAEKAAIDNQPKVEIIVMNKGGHTQ
jgi:hypothetical protein